MIATVQLCIMLVAIIAVMVAVARKLAVPVPILLVPTGLLLTFIPGLPTIRLNPHLVLLLFLPPLVFVGAAGMAWQDFKANLRPISLLAVGCVLFTTVAAAAVMHGLVGMPWAVACVLGAVVSPPDVVAAVAIAGKLKLPKRITTILQGEGLVNDATALILFGFAENAVMGGTFSPWKACGAFAAVVVGETIWGLGVGWVIARLRNWASDPIVEVLILFLAPFASYWPVEHFGGSGVLATVAAGLYIGSTAPNHISSVSRLAARIVSHFMAFVLEGLLFLLTGLQFGAIEKRLGGISLFQQALYAAVICAVVIVVRFLWVYPATYLPRLLVKSLARDDPSPAWEYPFIISFAGMRGAVSLAAAMSIPLLTTAGAPFPRRDLIIFLTFCVIVVTLVGQGLLLPPMIRFFRLHEAGEREANQDLDREIEGRRLGVQAALDRLDQLSKERHISDAIVQPLRRRHEARLKYLDRFFEDGGRKSIEAGQDLQRELLAAERNRIFSLQQEGVISPAVRKRIERELDLEDVRLRRGDDEQ